MRNRWLLCSGMALALVLAGCGRLVGIEDVSCMPCVHHDDASMGALLDAARSKYGEIPGMAVAMIIGDDIYLAVRGVRDAVTKVPLQETDAFPLSLTTTGLTGALLAKEVDRGELTWDLTVQDVYPALFGGSAQPAYAGVTVEELASYSSGLPHDTSASLSGIGEAANDYASYPSLIERRSLFTRDAVQDHPLYPPGTATALAGGQIIAASMLEQVTGIPYEQLMEERLFAPLQMTHSKWTSDVSGHDVNGTPVPYSRVQLRSPELGVCQSVEDLARFAYVYLGSPQAPRYYSAAASRRLRAAARGTSMTPSLAAGADNLSGGVWFAISGSTGVDYSYVGIRPNLKQAIVVLTNYTGDAAGDPGAGFNWVANQLIQNTASYFPGVISPSFPYRTSPTYQVHAELVDATSATVTGYEPVHAFDGDYGTQWTAGAGVTDATLTVNLPAPATVTGAVMNEAGPVALPGTPASTYGITQFDLYLDDGSGPYLAASDDHIGPNMEIQFSRAYPGISRAWLTLHGASLALTEFQLLP